MNITATLIGQSITFIIFVLFCMKFVWPALLNVMAEREKRIAEGLQAAERADKDLELAKQKASEQLREAKEQAASIVELAKKQANKLIEQASEQAKEEAARIKTQAEAEVELEMTQAREKLRSEVAALALAGAEKVLGSSIDAAKHNAMLEQLATQL